MCLAHFIFVTSFFCILVTFCLFTFFQRMHFSRQDGKKHRTHCKENHATKVAKKDDQNMKKRSYQNEMINTFIYLFLDSFPSVQWNLDWDCQGQLLHYQNLFLGTEYCSFLWDLGTFWAQICVHLCITMLYHNYCRIQF